ncbi:MAG: ABC transporter permease, partial [Christensenellales bacterium]
STRIIKMNDGQVVGDSNEYTLEQCLADEEEQRKVWEAEDAEKTRMSEEKKASRKKTSAVPKKQTVVKKVVTGATNGVKKFAHSLRRKGNTHMSFGTAVRLSASNLNSKKGRSLLTSLAGSIGIIGIMLVLCLSNGARVYINRIEENALSVYPMTVSPTNTPDLTSMVSLLQEKDPDREKYPDNGIVTPKKVLGNMVESIFNSLISKPNDLADLKQYIGENFNDEDGYVKYDYGVDFSVFCNYVGDEKNYMQVDPFLEGMTALFDGNPQLKEFLDNSGMLEMLEGNNGIASMMSVWEQLPDNNKLLTSQYELIGDKSRWPSAWDEVVLIVDNQNQVYDFSLFALGLAGEEEVGKAISGNGDFLNKQFTVDELLNLEYRIMTNSDYYQKVLDESGNWTGEWDDRAAKTAGGYDFHRKIEFVESHSVPVKVVGVIRPKPGVTITCMNGLVGYTGALQEKLSERAMQSDIYKAQMENPSEAVVDYHKQGLKTKGDKLDDNNRDDIAKYLGVADFDTPEKIYFYANSFVGKDNIDAFLKTYNEEKKANVEYKDMLGMITGYVDTLTETITYVLVGFAAISLIVSSIMIAIIIYTSVLERRKEIGVLRSIGARKKDISTVFISESSILGVISGLIGILISYVLSVIANAIIFALLEIPNLASLAWWHPVMMLLISVALSILSGFVPSRIASNKNPVECLRSE